MKADNIVFEIWLNLESLASLSSHMMTRLWMGRALYYQICIPLARKVSGSQFLFWCKRIRISVFFGFQTLPISWPTMYTYERSRNWPVSYISTSDYILEEMLSRKQSTRWTFTINQRYLQRQYFMWLPIKRQLCTEAVRLFLNYRFDSWS